VTAVRGWGGLVLLLLAGAPRPVLALDPARDPALYERQRWGVEEGFPGDGIHGITQGDDGYLWIASERGLLRFDGTEFRRVAAAGEAERSGAADVLGIVRDARGDLWLRPDRPDLLRFRDGRVSSVPFATDPREVAVTAMAVGRDGALLLYAQLGGLLARRGEGFQRVPLDPLPPSLVLAIAQTAEGTLFLGTRDSGLFQIRDGRAVPVVEGLPNRKVNCLLAEGERDLWIGTDRGLARWTGTSLTQDGVPERMRTVQTLALLRDRDANLWVGTSDGLLRLDAHGAVADALAPRGAVTALYEDREGDLWVGGSGLERLQDTPFATYGRAQGLPADGGGAVYADAGGRVWFAPAEGGLYALEGDRALRIPIGGVEPDRVYSIAGARDGLWLGRQRGGLTHLRIAGTTLSATSHVAIGGPPRSGVYAVHEARDGSVWAGTLNAGLARLKDGGVETFTAADGLPSNSINTLLDGSDGTLWVGTPAGLAARSAGAWTTRRVRDGLPSDNVNALLEDAEGVLWIGTAEGLAFLRAGRVEVPRDAPALRREAVVGLAESEGGWLWIATARRVMRVRRAALLDGAAGPGDLVSYGRADGLVGLEGVRRHRSVVADGRGRVWFATNQGLSVVQPRRALLAPPPPLVHVRALLADERPVELGDGVRLPPRPRNVRIAYTGVSLRAPGRVRFRYSLDGLDPRWSEPVSTETAVYANLGPGAYRFRVQAAGPDGLWSGAPAEVGFTIAPAIWQTAWFRLAAALGVAFGAWLVYTWRLQQATRRLNAAFDERLAERTRIAQELHDTLLQGFISASMQLHVAAGQVPAGTPARAQLASVQDLTRQVIEEARHAVQGLRTEDRDDGDLAQALSRAGADLAGASPAALRVIVKGTQEALHPSVHDAVYRIGREALANAFRHARAAQVELELEYAPRMVRLLVRDDGAGVDPEVLRSGREGHFGLSGMRERAERIGGRLRLWSAPGAGTEVELVVRGQAAYAAPTRGRRWGGR
jgi:signal transduction histidine kinase/ligand-binding sensor domain-containing protein